MKVEFTYYKEFFHVATDNYKEIVKLEKEHSELFAKASKSNKFIDKLRETDDRIVRLVLIVVVFCATSLDTYINHYAISHLSRNYFKNYLDKLDLLSKWIVIPRIITGTQLDAGSRPLQDLSWLITLRNELLHYKSKKVSVEEIKDTDLLWGKHAERAIETVKNVAQELKKIDNNISIEWTTTSYNKYPYFD